MPDVVKHGWTHRPRSQGGTDPIEIAASPTPVGYFSEGQNSRTTGSKLEMTYGFFCTNDSAVFGYDDVTSSKAKYMTISEDGFYRAEFQINWTTDFTAGDQPLIEPSCESFGTNGPLVNPLSIYWDNTGEWIGGQQITAAEMDHHMVTASVVFQYEAADFGETPLKIGCNLRTNNSRTKDIGSMIVCYRISTELLAPVTIT